MAVFYRSFKLVLGLLRISSLDILDTSSSEFDIPMKLSILELKFSYLFTYK